MIISSDNEGVGMDHKVNTSLDDDGTILIRTKNTFTSIQNVYDKSLQRNYSAELSIN